MRHLSFILLLFIVVCSWQFIHKTPAVSEWVHWQLQEELQNVIKDQVIRKMPSANHIKFQKIWTENLKRNQVKAFFSYTYQDSSTGDSLGHQGYAILQRQTRETQMGELYSTWKIINLHLPLESIVFESDLVGPSDDPPLGSDHN